MTKPALTAEEWAVRAIDEHQVRWYPSVIEVGYVGPTNEQHIPCQRYHALAALALYGQPFGFTREDVEALRSVASQISDGDKTAGAWVTPHSGWADAALSRIADRIEALLPPEE